MTAIEAFILVGGRSTRFGTDKASFIIDGRPMAVRVADAVRSALEGTRISLVAADASQFRDAGVFDGLPLIYDLIPGCGAWSGLDAALHTSQADLTLVLACDLAGITSGFISRLAGEAAATQAGAVISRQADGRLQPLCAVYDTAAARPVVRNVILRGGPLPRLETLVELLSAEVLMSAEDNDDLLNVNRTDDLASLRRGI